MCIRDSFDRSPQFISNTKGAYNWNQAVRAEYDAFRTFNACLLYTSDAADERSSVDLGGRRLIKKKKNIKKRTQPWY